MPSSGMRGARKPAYIDKLLRSDPGASVPRAARPQEELFLHLGYWPDPAVARTDFPELVAAQGRLNDRLLELADLSDGQHVLDVGCGIGGTIAAVGSRYQGMDLVGLNIDAGQLDVATANVRPRAGNRCAWLQGDASSLPFRDASFDRVLAVECIFHFPSRQRFLAEAARLLKPDGLLVLSDFVVAPSLRALRDSDEYPGFAVEATIIPAVGPWPDFWDGAADVSLLAPAVGLRSLSVEDASRQTLPSYQCFLHGKQAQGRFDATRLDPVDRAMVLMEWLQTRRYLSMKLFAFQRCRSPEGEVRS